MSPETLIHQRLEVSPAELEAFCRKWDVARLEVFGSAVRDDFSAGSDVDFLVSFEAGVDPAGVDWFQLKEELARLVGREVDVVNRRLVESSRNRYRRQHILREAVPVHGS